MHDRVIGALELCCRRGEMALIQNKRVDWDTYTIGIPGHTTKDDENRRIPFDPDGRLAAILRRRAKLGPNAFVFGTENGQFVGSTSPASRRPGSRCSSSPTVTTPNARNQVLASIEPSCGRLTCTGMTCVTRGRAVYLRMAWTFASSS